ncbi:MAG: SLBB domain-containing protein, partial [Myxococcota bacterium]
EAVKAGDLEGYLTKQLERSFRNFTLSASLAEVRSIEVYVVGHAARPGKHAVSSLSSAVNALFLTGGPSPSGSYRRVQLVRDGKVYREIDLYPFLTSGLRPDDVALLSGDTLVIPAAGPRVALVGEVRTTAIYELLGETDTVGSLVALQGGLPPTASPRRALLERLDASAPLSRSVKEVALAGDGLGLSLRDGDMLRVLPVSPAFENAVTLRGNVAEPGRYPYREGMRVRDLVPTRGALVPRSYHERRNDLVFDGEAGLEEAERAATQRSDEVNWEYAVIERLDTKALTTTLLPFHLGKAVLDGDARENLELRAGDVVTVFSQDDIRVPNAKRLRLVRVEGEVGAPGVYQLRPAETLPQLLERVGGLTSEAYVFGTALRRRGVQEAQEKTLDRVVRTLESQVRFDLANRRANLRGSDAALQEAQLAAEEKLVEERLEKLRSVKPNGRIALELDPEKSTLPDVALEDGDTVLVPPRPSFVSVLGAVHTENSILHREGRTVDDYLKVAGVSHHANLAEVFVVRADGSVRARGRGWFDWLMHPVRGLR